MVERSRPRLESLGDVYTLNRASSPSFLWAKARLPRLDNVTHGRIVAVGGHDETQDFAEKAASKAIFSKISA